MDVSASFDKFQPVVHYRLTPTAGGVTMELGEPRVSAVKASPVSSVNVYEPPYQFRLKHHFTSEGEAIAALEQYLAVNPVTTAIADQLEDWILSPYETITV